MKSHREAHPEQYEHPRCGAEVKTPTGLTDRIERVVQDPRFGQLAILKSRPEAAWPIANLQVVGE